MLDLKRREFITLLGAAAAPCGLRPASAPSSMAGPAGPFAGRAGRTESVRHADVSALRRPHALLERDEATVGAAAARAAVMDAPRSAGRGLRHGGTTVDDGRQHRQRQCGRKGADGVLHCESPIVAHPRRLNTRSRALFQGKFAPRPGGGTLRLGARRQFDSDRSRSPSGRFHLFPDQGGATFAAVLRAFERGCRNRENVPVEFKESDLVASRPSFIP